MNNKTIKPQAIGLGAGSLLRKSDGLGPNLGDERTKKGTKRVRQRPKPFTTHAPSKETNNG